MNDLKISDAMEHIDDGLISDAVTFVRKRKSPAKWIALAACLGVILLGAVGGVRSGIFKAEKTEPSEKVQPKEPTVTAEIQPSPSPAATGRDRTVHFDGFDITGKEVFETIGGSEDMSIDYRSCEALIPDSGYIVRGHVVKVTYSHDGGFAIMLYDVLLDEVWLDRAHEGDEALAAGDTITVFQSGGYITGEVFCEYRGGRPDIPADSILKQEFMGMPFPEEGAEYVLFLQDPSEPKYDGVYTVTGIFQGRYEVNGGIVSRFFPGQDSLYTDDGVSLDAFRETVSDAIKNGAASRFPTPEELMEEYIAGQKSFIDYERESFEAMHQLEENRDYLESLQAPLDKLPGFFDRVLKRADEIASKADTHPSVLMLSQNTPEKTYGGDTFASTIIERAGACNGAGKLRQTDFSLYNAGEADITVEQIAELDPDIIVIWNTVNISCYTADDILSDPAWQDISAVKNGRVYEARATDAWFAGEGASPSRWMGVCWLQTLLYPDEYPEEQFRQDVREYYDIMYSDSPLEEIYTEEYDKRFG